MTTVRPTSFQLETGWEDKPRTFSQDTLQGQPACLCSLIILKTLVSGHKLGCPHSSY